TAKARTRLTAPSSGWATTAVSPTRSMLRGYASVPRWPTTRPRSTSTATSRDSRSAVTSAVRFRPSTDEGVSASAAAPATNSLRFTHLIRPACARGSGTPRARGSVGGSNPSKEDAMLRRLVPALIALVLVPAAGADGPGLVSGVWGGPGVPSPTSPVRYVTVPTGRSTLLEAVRRHDGAVLAWRVLDGSWSTPAVTVGGVAGGLTRDGR